LFGFKINPNRNDSHPTTSPDCIHGMNESTDAPLNTRGLHIWVDADACPLVIKEILFRVANRTSTPVTLIANQMLYVPPSPWIKSLQVPSGFDVADQRIASEAHAGDVVVTADIPLAALVIEKRAWVIDPRGDLLDHDTIQAKLTMRNFMEGLRESGVQTGGPAAFSAKDARNFANQLDRLLAKSIKPSRTG
jgi:uncharacterized protein